MFHYLRQKRSVRFVIISSLLIVAAIGAAMISTVARQVGEYELASLGSKSALGLALIIVLYVAPKLARSMRFEYLRSEFSVRISNSGLIFCSLILIVTILALSSGNNLFYLVLAVLLATMLISWFASRLCLGRMDVAVRFPDHIFVDELVPFDVTVINRKRFLSGFSIAISLSEQNPATSPKESPDRVDLSYFPIIPARTQARMRIERNFTRRGIYPVQGFVLSTKFPFGFLEQRRLIEAQSEIAVYPQPRLLDDSIDLLPLTQGRVESRIKGGGSDLYAIRQYLSSDHHHHIDWKATAKTNQFMVREFTRDDDWRITIGFDTQVEKETARKAEFPERFEKAIIVAASLIDCFIEAGAEVRLLTSNDDSGFGMGRMHYYAMLRQLAPLAPETEEAGTMREVDHLFSPLFDGEEQLRILITSSPHNLQAPQLLHSTQVISLEEL